jgi:dihydrofolate reductase
MNSLVGHGVEGGGLLVDQATHEETSKPLQRKVIYSMMVSLDGYIESESGEIDWSAPDQELFEHFNASESEIDTHLYGRRMYENMAGWLKVDENPDASEQEVDFARIWKQVQKVVFSTTMKQADWNTILVKDNIAEAVAELKAQPGKHMDLGGTGIAAAFMELDLIDEYRLYIHPIVLGGGKPMFAALADRVKLELVEARTFGSSGVVLLRYKPANSM